MNNNDKEEKPQLEKTCEPIKFKIKVKPNQHGKDPIGGNRNDNNEKNLINAPSQVANLLPLPTITPEIKSTPIKFKIKPTQLKLNVIDLFCGCGGMTKGLVEAGLA